jgi:hypothetical protein
MKGYLWERFKAVMYQVDHISFGLIIEKANVTCGFYSSVDTSLSSSINWGSGNFFASVRYALQSTETLKSISCLTPFSTLFQLYRGGQFY